MAEYTQEARRMALETPLGADALLLTSLEGEERMSGLFRFDLEALADRGGIPPRDIVGKSATITLRRSDNEPRYFNGHVSRFAYLGKSDRLHLYRLEVVPWLWFLTQTSDCRVFQRKSVQEIVSRVFDDLGFSDYAFQLGGSHPKYEYCVQYRETDFNFVSRLMEQEGIFYFFDHANGSHKLVLSDGKRAYKECPGQEREVDAPRSLSAPELGDLIRGWEHSYGFRPGKWAHTDYNFVTPQAGLMAKTRTVVKLDGADKFELYEYPGAYEKRADGESYAKVRMEEQETPHEVVHGVGMCRTFSPGFKFKLREHQDSSEQGKSYVVTGVRHAAKHEGYLTGGAQEEYSNRFTAIPADVVFRPARATPKPVVQGVQSAVVTGPAGEEIYTDEYGRVKVQFFWDREGKKDENTSCWLRVGQASAGAKWGAVYIPRIGGEVLVSFLDGDPDRPIIVGSVYNADLMPPYGLPDNKTQSGLKTSSSPGGEGSNELRFEDKKDAEDVFFHAQKDFHREVENDDDLKVRHDQAIEVKNNRTETVKEGHEQVTIEKGNRLVTISGGNDTHQIKKGNREVTIDMGNDTLTIKMGNQTTKLDLGKSQTEAMQSIEFKVGQSSVKIDQTGVTIKGMLVKVEGQVQTEIKGLMTQVSGTAMLKAGGGITMLG